MSRSRIDEYRAISRDGSVDRTTKLAPHDPDAKAPCEIHYWPSEGLAARVSQTAGVRRRMGLRGVFMCGACAQRLVHRAPPMPGGKS